MTTNSITITKTIQIITSLTREKISKQIKDTINTITTTKTKILNDKITITNTTTMTTIIENTKIIITITTTKQKYRPSHYGIAKVHKMQENKTLI